MIATLIELSFDVDSYADPFTLEVLLSGVGFVYGARVGAAVGGLGGLVTVDVDMSTVVPGCVGTIVSDVDRLSGRVGRGVGC